MARVKSIAVIALLFVCARAGAELPPQVYAEMQEKAPEFLKIEVLTATQDVVTNNDAKPKGSKTVLIQATAKVIDVERSQSKLKDGDIIKIAYTRTERPVGIGWVGPSEPPILKKGETTEAFLSKSHTDETYGLAARGMSFRSMEE